MEGNLEYKYIKKNRNDGLYKRPSNSEERSHELHAEVALRQLRYQLLVAYPLFKYHHQGLPIIIIPVIITYRKQSALLKSVVEPDRFVISCIIQMRIILIGVKK